MGTRPVTAARLLVVGLAAAVLSACGTPSGSAPTPAGTGTTHTAGATRPSSAGSPSRAATATTAGSTSATSGTSPTAGAGPTSSAGGSCADLATRMSRSERVGQLFMVGENSEQISSTQFDAIRDSHLGSVILLGNTTEGNAAVRQLTDQIRSRAGRADGVQVLLAADQEGGLVQRLKGSGFDTIPSAQGQASYSDASLQSHAETWAGQLARAGIDADLAPVADVVPDSMRSVNEPIGVLHRGYGSDPGTVAAKVTAFVRGMQAGRIATSVKHFPGLGRVRGNTDTDTGVVDRVTTRHDADLAGFQAGVRAGADLVMVSSAVYARIDPDRPAAFSTTVLQGMIRSDLGFDGVIISDDLNGQALSSVSVGDRAVRFVQAGGDLAIVGDPALVGTMIDQTLAQARQSTGFDAQVTAAATKVLIMKARYGLADCS